MGKAPACWLIRCTLGEKAGQGRRALSLLTKGRPCGYNKQYRAGVVQRLVHQPSKLRTRVRLPSPAPRRSKLCIACSGLFYKSERAHAAAPPSQTATAVPGCGFVFFLENIVFNRPFQLYSAGTLCSGAVLLYSAQLPCIPITTAPACHFCGRPGLLCGPPALHALPPSGPGISPAAKRIAPSSIHFVQVGKNPECLRKFT